MPEPANKEARDAQAVLLFFLQFRLPPMYSELFRCYELDDESVFYFKPTRGKPRYFARGGIYELEGWRCKQVGLKIEEQFEPLVESDRIDDEWFHCVGGIPMAIPIDGPSEEAA